MKLLVSVLALSFSVASLATELNMKPGLWAIKMEVNTKGKKVNLNAEMEKALAKMTPEQRQKLQEMMGGSALDTQGTRICYSKAMLNPSKFIEGQEQDHCKSTLVKSTSTEIVTKFECQDGSKGEANWKISNPSTFAGVVDVTNGKGEKSKMTYQGKFLATDCGKLKPVI